MPALAQQAVRELQEHRRLTLRTQLLIQCLEPQETSALSKYLPSLEVLNTLDLENEKIWGWLLAATGLVADFEALSERARLGRRSALAAIVADQGLILEHILQLAVRVGRPFTDKLYELPVRCSSYNCIVMLLRFRPQSIEFLMLFALKSRLPEMVAFLVKAWPPSVKRDLDEFLVIGSTFADQDWDVVRPLIDAGAKVTSDTMKAAAGAQNLEFMSFYSQMGVTDLNPAVAEAFQRRAETSLQWLKFHGANPQHFLEQSTYLQLYLASSLLLKYWPEYINLLLVKVARKGQVDFMAELLDQGATDLQGAVEEALQDNKPQRRRQKLILLGATSQLSWSEWLQSWLS